ncbi:hypothetical protein [Micromonospora sp. NPDC047527]|uniref:hypothetical protein n=1 Tax=unclassified Micromonospora TaxID=2617518 RepID=UPI0033E1FB22
MRGFTRLRQRGQKGLILTTVAVVAAQVSVTAPVRAEERDWRAEVAAIPTTRYTRDAKLSITETEAAVRSHLDDLGKRRYEPVLADLRTRYFDGARLTTAQDGATAYDNLAHLSSYLHSRVGNGDVFVDALVGELSTVRLLADAAVQDANATIAPFRAIVPPPPAPSGLEQAFGDLESGQRWLTKADDQLRKANAEPATRHASKAYDSARNVLTRFGITYTGDRDGDGIEDGVELRFGASPLLADSDGDGLTDKFEIYGLTPWTLPNNADTDGDGVPDGQEDQDSDGLTNLREQELGTSPTESDTDGDGVSDGIEVSRGTNPLVADPRNDPPLGGGAPPIVPTPNETDTDGDGLTDVAEGEALTDENNVDSDGDGLSDGAEVNDWGINPLNPDTDGDSLRDDYETVHVEDQGLDPSRPDEQVSKWTYVTDFLLGMFAGDFSPRDSMAWLSGNLCSGGLSAIPVVGWILGGLADLRDTIAGLIQGDWVSAGLSILGVVPYVGDAIAIPGKAARFVVRFAHRIDDTLRFVTKYDKIPDAVKDVALDLILGATYDYLTAGDDTLAARILAAKSRFSDKDIRDLSRGDRTKWKDIEDAMKAPNHTSGDPIPAQYNWRDGENAVAALLQGCIKNVKVLTPGYPRAGSKWRKPDCIEQDPTTGDEVFHEVKTGVPTWTESLIDECLKDAWILTSAGKAAHGHQNVTKVHWHFVAHAGFNSIGIHPPLLQCLKDNNIEFTIHAPSGP